MSIIDGELASRTSSDPEVKALVLWLKSVPVDQNTIDKVNSSFFFNTWGCLVLLIYPLCGLTTPVWSCFLVALSWVHLGLSHLHGLQGWLDVLWNKVSRHHTSPSHHPSIQKCKKGLPSEVVVQKRRTSSTSLFWVPSKSPGGVWHRSFVTLHSNLPNTAVSEVACCVESGQPSQPAGRPSSAHTIRTAGTLFFNSCWCCTSKDRSIDGLVLSHLEEVRQRWT